MEKGEVTGDCHSTTDLLGRASRGDRRAADELVPLVYKELRVRALRFLRRESARTSIDATSLVHEAYLRLVDQSAVDYKGRTHFLALAAMQMRRVLVDRARRRRAAVHGGGLARVTLHEDLLSGADPAVDVLDLDDALAELERLNARQARMVELRFFSGLTMREVADSLGVALATAEKDWRMARAWLLRRLEGNQK